MPLVALGKIVVAAAGTPVPLSSVTGGNNCTAIYFSTIQGQSGQQMYVGTKTMVKATLVGVYKILQKPIAATPVYLDNWILQNFAGACVADANAIYLDADTSGDGLLVTLLV